MNDQQKIQIAAALAEFLKKKGMSQNEFARKFKFSSANISHVLRGKHDASISDNIWRNLAQILQITTRWQLYGTRNYKAMIGLFEDTRELGTLSAIIGFQGAGKTETMKKYSRENPDAYHVHANISFSGKKVFMQAICAAMGLPAVGQVHTMLASIANKLNNNPGSLLMIDQADKLSDSGIMLIQAIYDEIIGNSGMIISGTPVLRERFEKAAKSNKTGYRELVDRVSHWEELTRPSEKSIAEISRLNGISDSAAIDYLCRVVPDYRVLYNVINKARICAKKMKSPVNVHVLESLKIDNYFHTLLAA